MTLEERIAAVRCFGYNAQEAGFLVIAALHSGYFLRRQYLSFVDGTKGWKDVLFIQKLKANRHCRVTVCRHNRMIYHLSAKPLYAALGEADNRNRREHQPSTMKNKLMSLDFVLEHWAGQYLATEREKLRYFTGALHVAHEDLPTRWYESPGRHKATARHFAEKYPIFLAHPADGGAPVVHFCYIDEGLQSVDRFCTFLTHHMRLFGRLPDYRVIYVAESDRLFEAARCAFETVLAGKGSLRLDPKVSALLDYFEARRRFETRDFSGFDTAGIIRYRDQKKRYAAETYDDLYHRWQTGGTEAILALLCPDQTQTSVHPNRFSTYILVHNYDLLGTLTHRPPLETKDAAFQTQP